MRGSHQDSFNNHHHSNSHPKQQPSIVQQPVQQDSESRLARVKRVLLGRSSGNSSNNNNNNNNNGSSRRCFGQELELAERHNETGVPLVVHRLCGFIEAHGSRDPNLLRPQQTMLAIRLRLSFERRGDADLEGASCPPSTAVLLLREYLQELPRPIVGPTNVSKLLQLYSHERGQSQERWIEQTRDLLVNELSSCDYRILGYLLLFLSRCAESHRITEICAYFAPVLLPHVPPATVLMRDLLIDARLIFNDLHGVKDSTVNGVITVPDCKDPKDDYNHASDKNLLLLVCPTKPPKRKDRRDSCGQERKLIRSNSEEKIWEKRAGDEENNSSNSADTIRRVWSHEDFNSAKHHHILSKLQKEMGHGLRPLQERTNVSPVSSKSSLIYSPSEAVLAEKFNCDAERLRNSERFSRSIAPRGRRQVRRKKLFLNTNFDQGSSKENEINESEKIFTLNPDSSNFQNQSFLEMLNSGPSRSPSPSRPPFEQEDANNPTLANWSFQNRQNNDEIMSERVEAISPRNSILIPRRFYSEDEPEDQENLTDVREYGLKGLVKHINSLKKKIKKYEGEFEENFGYRPSHSDKMSNRDIKKIMSELNKVRKEHKILKEGFISTLLGGPKSGRDDDIGVNNNNNDDKFRSAAMSELVKDIDRKLAEKRLKGNRPENMEDLSYEQLLEEKTAVQKALLHIENTLGRPVSKEDRSVVRPLYDRYRTLKRLLIRAGANRQQDSMSELATILEHETMDFSSASGTPVDCERRASEPDMSHRGILDCIDSIEPTDSDSQHSSSEGSRGIVESLHSLSRDELLQQQRITKEEKKRLRRALKELEMQFEARAGRRMKREDRGSQVHAIYDSYKQTKAKLRLISALLAKSS